MVISCCLKYRLSSQSMRIRFRKCRTASRLLMSLQLGVRSIPERQMRMGMISPLAGQPSITSNRTRVSFSVMAFAPCPTISLRMMAISMSLIFMRTRWKETFPKMQSFRWQKDLLYSNSMCRHSSIPTSSLMAPTSSSASEGVGSCTAKSISLTRLTWQLRTIETRRQQRTLPATPQKVSQDFSNLGNRNLQFLFSVRAPAGSSSLAMEMKSVERVLSEYISRWPMSSIRMPRCSIRRPCSLISTTPDMSSSPVYTGSFTLAPDRSMKSAFFLRALGSIDTSMLADPIFSRLFSWL